MDTKRPRLSIPLTNFDYGAEVLGLLALSWMVAMFIVDVPKLPQIIPTHFGFSGKPDAWGPKSTIYPMLWLSMAMYVGLSILSRFPHIYNYPWPITQENAEAQYRLGRSVMTCMKVASLWLFSYLTWQTIQIARGHSHGFSPWFPLVFVGFMFASLAIFIWKAYQAR